MSQEETLVRLKCSECERLNYWTRRNKQSNEKKLELKKFCKQCRKHEKHVETKKKNKK